MANPEHSPFKKDFSDRKPGHLAVGSLGSADLTGSFTRSDMLRPTVPVSRERVQLKMKPSDSMFAAGPYAEWKRRADEILKYRGPKW